VCERMGTPRMPDIGMHVVGYFKGNKGNTLTDMRTGRLKSGY